MHCQITQELQSHWSDRMDSDHRSSVELMVVEAAGAIGLNEPLGYELDPTRDHRPVGLEPLPGRAESEPTEAGE